MCAQAELPEDLVLGESYLSFLFINYVDHMIAEADTRVGLSEVGFVRKSKWTPKPEYYSPYAQHSPNLLSRIEEGGATDAIELQTIPNTALQVFRSLVQRDTASGLYLVDIRGTVTEQVYLYSSGALCYRVDLHYTEAAGVDQLLLVANGIVKYDGAFRLAAERLCPAEVFDTLLGRINAVAGRGRADAAKSERYTIISAVRLGDTAERVLLEHSELRRKLYKVYENQIHALSVRTIENWRERFPQGAEFPDKNISTSSVGVVRVNFRNTFICDFPYSRVIAEELYSHAIVELRCWAFMLQHFISDTSRLIDQLVGGINQELLDTVLHRRAAILDALDDFSSWMLARSFRTRNFLSNAIRIMQLGELTAEVHRKMANVSQLAQDYTITRQLNEQSASTRQLLSLTNEMKILQDEQAKTGKTLSFINVIVSAAISFTIVDIFSLPWWLGCAGFVVLLSAFMWSVRRTT